MRSSLTQRQMREYDHEALADTIVRRLSELSVEEKHRAHINAWTNNRASPSAAFLATDANIPKLNKDPIKNARPSCAICGNAGHTEEQCFPNELASCPKAISRAPVGTPLYHKHHLVSVGSQPSPPRNGGRHKAAKPSSASTARALAASFSRPSKREVAQALADTLARCGVLTDEDDRRVLMILTASPPTHHADRIIAVSNSSPMMRSSTAPHGALGKFANPHLHGLLRPCAEQAIEAAHRLLSLAMLPSKIACNVLSEATSLCERVQGGLRSLLSRRDTPLDDNVSSTALDPQHAPLSLTCAHAFVASAAASSSLQKVKNASSTEHVSAVVLAVDSGSTWHLHHQRDQLTNLRP